MTLQAKGLVGGCVVAGLLLAGAFYQMLMPVPFAVQCLFKRVFGVPCPTCGMTRALKLLFAGRGLDGVRMQPLILIIPLYVIFGVVVLGCAEWSANSRFSKSSVLVFTALAVLGVNWMFLIGMNR